MKYLVPPSLCTHLGPMTKVKQAKEPNTLRCLQCGTLLVVDKSKKG